MKKIVVGVYYINTLIPMRELQVEEGGGLIIHKEFFTFPNKCKEM